MSSIYRTFKCRVCHEKKSNPCDRDIGICQDCDDYKKEEERELKKYRTIIIDFPWNIKSNFTDERYYRCGRPMPYKVMADVEIEKFPIDEFADNCCDLFLWTTHSKLPFTLKLIEKWGFKYHCLITWDKTNGIGINGFQRRTEMVVYAYRGKMGVIRTKGHYIPTLITEKLTTHSTKPNLFYIILKERTLKPRLDIFARRRHDGFDAWGDQVEKEKQTQITSHNNSYE